VAVLSAGAWLRSPGARRRAMPPLLRLLPDLGRAEAVHQAARHGRRAGRAPGRAAARRAAARSGMTDISSARDTRITTRR
jgi:hypothetical protein